MTRLLVAYAANSTHVSTTRDYLESFARHSTFDVRYVNVTDTEEHDYDLSAFDAVFQSYCARWQIENYINPWFIDALDSFCGVKLLAVQDEYERTDRIRAAIQHLAYDVVFTCVPSPYIATVYPSHLFPHTEFVNVLTGYAPDRTFEAAPISERPVHVGYRGRELFISRYGNLAFEKLEIGRHMKEECAARHVPHDIEWSEDARLYGDAWFKWLGHCRTVLGSESGSNTFDFGDGLVDMSPFLDMAQISPRVFEAAATRTPMILFDGHYSGIIEPWIHYIPLRKDFGNIEGVFNLLDATQLLTALAERAHSDLIASGRYSYESFVRTVENCVRNRTKSCASAVADSFISNPEFTSRPHGTTHAHYTRLLSDVRHRSAAASQSGEL